MRWGNSTEAGVVLLACYAMKLSVPSRVRVANESDHNNSYRVNPIDRMTLQYNIQQIINDIVFLAIG